LLTTLFIIALALLAVAYAALPLLGRRGFVDPLPDDRDPVIVDLEEERDALLRALRELEARSDLSADRRDTLRARYEAKTAAVLKALEAPRTPARAAPRRAGGRSLPYGALGLLAIAAVTTSTLGTWVLPRVGQSTVTAFFEDDLIAATALRDRIRAVERDASVANLMALGDAYWSLADVVNADTTYRRVLSQHPDAAPALAYQRVALGLLERDLPGALSLLRIAQRVEPDNAETLYAIGELSFALGDLAGAEEGFAAYVATPEGAQDAQAQARLALVRAIGPASEAIERERSEANLLTLADVFWEAEALDPAVELYFEVLTQHDAVHPTALSRIGQLLFIRGRVDDAQAVLERAAEAAGGLERLEPQASLFLGNAYAIAGDDANSVRAYRAHVAIVGVEAAGRVTGLIEAGEARLALQTLATAAVGPGAPVALAPAAANPAAASPVAASPVAASPVAASSAEAIPVAGDAAAPAAADATQIALTGAALALAALDDPRLLDRVGADLYAAHCALCHGSTGQGGSGPRLVGNLRAANEANVRSLIRFGRGLMPGFGARLEDPEIEVLVSWVGQNLATPR
jgi:mono/diheme cytochrome c family protein